MLNFSENIAFLEKLKMQQHIVLPIISDFKLLNLVVLRVCKIYTAIAYKIIVSIKVA